MKDHNAKTGGRWVADEMQVDVGGKKVWLWNVMDAETRYILASHLTPNRDAQAARVVLRKAALAADKPPKTITTDKLRSYIQPIKDVLPEGRHIQSDGYLWLYYSGNEAQIVSGEQRAHASLDLRILDVPLGLTSDSFHDWIRLSLLTSPFMDTVRQFGGRTDAVVWDSVAAEWGVTRSIAARWVSTANNWLKYFDLDGQ